MPQCVNCGKRGLFLKLNVRGLCSECAEKVKMMPKSGQIIIGINDGITDVSVGHNREEDVCNYFINELVKRGKKRDMFKIQHRAEDYTSLFFDMNDFIRVKYTSNVHWISIALTSDDQQKYMSDLLFSKQFNKNMRHWKSEFNTFSDLSRYVDMAENACFIVTYNYDRELTLNERKVMDYLMKLFVDCGARQEKFYCQILSQDASVIYYSQFGDIRFKAYAKKQGGYIVLDRIFSDAGIMGENGRYPFKELSELDFLKEKLIPLKIEKGLDDTYSSDMKYFSKYPFEG